MSARLRVWIVVLLAAGAAAAVAVGATVLTRDDSAEAPRAIGGAPPLVLELAADEPAARELRHAQRLYARGRRAAARKIFAQHADSADGAVGEAMARWPGGAVAALRQLARREPRLAVVRLNLGFALFWAGSREAAVREWRTALRVQPDSPSALRAEDLLHPDLPRGRPVFVPSFRPSGGRRPVHRQLLRGVALQRAGRPVSAQRAYAEAVAQAPRAVEPRVALAVARFTKSAPERAFSRLGPLARARPRAQTARFHLGLLLLWIGEVREARGQLVLARRLGPRTRLGREANGLLTRLER